ncbi:MAG TPA: hypothetical protein VII49_12960 [Rhizomicrobium sp.]
MSAVFLNSLGLVLNLAGVLLLFRYGMPYRTRTDGAQSILLEKKDESAIRVERMYGVYGWTGMVLIVTGTILQITANWLPAVRCDFS